MDHLVCFFPGLLALGVLHLERPAGDTRNERDMAVARGLMYTCWQMYERQATGIAPEMVNFIKGNDMLVRDWLRRPASRCPWLRVAMSIGGL
jgi:hypothetical protein